MTKNKWMLYLNSLLSIIGIVILMLDWNMTNEFNIEAPYIFAALGLLLLNCFRQMNPTFRSRKIVNVTNNLLLLGLITFNLYSILILSFGVGFTGRDYPFIMIIAGMYHFVFIPFIVYDLGFNYKQTSK